MSNSRVGNEGNHPWCMVECLLCMEKTHAVGADHEKPRRKLTYAVYPDKYYSLIIYVSLCFSRLKNRRGVWSSTPAERIR